ncbi:DUF6481 family protein [Loktanella sp. SALINAS62]|uniref:DUF6481 family protein n=1 Tax=Loktanella sp. SALINAS62 TaxID=2706124 RepID=UPI001B8C87D8|nr:DUF6481 family protein [Loktanella sp. SALINAS62]MBS1303291.1 hypothetical protein [Loktanella sp. SALINAS62]
MRNPKKNDFADRRSAAADAKAALLQSHRAAQEAAEPTRVARQEERQAVATARDARQAERAQNKRDEEDAVRTDALAAENAAKAEAESLKVVEKDLSVDVVADYEAARKAERDRRYAKRKAQK